MLRTKMNLIVILILLMSIPALAQMGQKDDDRHMMRGNKMQGNMMHRGMMGSGMMQGQHMMGNMHNTLHPYMRLVHAIPAFDDELSLTTSQSNKIIDLQTTFLKQKIDYRAEMNKKSNQLEELLEKDASTAEVKKLLEEIAGVKINMFTSAYETVNQMKGELNQEQLDKLNKIKQNHGMMSGGSKCGGHMKGGMMGDYDEMHDEDEEKHMMDDDDNDMHHDMMDDDDDDDNMMN